jgi:hypothetical protein
MNVKFHLGQGVYKRLKRVHAKNANSLAKR